MFLHISLEVCIYYFNKKVQIYFNYYYLRMLSKSSFLNIPKKHSSKHTTDAFRVFYTASIKASSPNAYLHPNSATFITSHSSIPFISG